MQTKTSKKEELREMISRDMAWEESQRIKRQEQALRGFIGSLSTYSVDRVLESIARGEVTVSLINGSLKAEKQTISLHLNHEGAWLYEKGQHPLEHGVSGHVLPSEYPVDAAKRLGLEWWGLRLPTARVHINKGNELELDAREIFGPGDGIELVGIHHRRSVYLTEYEYREVCKHPDFEWEYEQENGFILR
jgi:hypothetical protein